MAVLGELLACPVDRLPLAGSSGELVCERGHAFPVVDGVPVLLPADVPATLDLFDRSRRRARGDSAATDARAPELYLETIGVSEQERALLAVAARDRRPGGVDPVVASLVAATNGLLYEDVRGHVTEYPIPRCPVPSGRGLLLDVGCSWGRWTIAAARAGYTAVGIDPSLGAVMAARRVAAQLGVEASFVVGDARHLPFRSGAFERVFSYSVLQHFSRDDALLAVEQAGRVLRPSGECMVQMPNWLGLRCLYHQTRRGWRAAEGFDVRYWGLRDLRRSFEQRIGPASISAEGFLGLGVGAADPTGLSPSKRAVIGVSRVLEALSRRVSPLVLVADSVYVRSVKGA